MPSLPSSLRAALCLLLALAAFPSYSGGRDALLFVIADTGDCDYDGTRLVAVAMKAQPDWRQATLLEVGDLAYPAATRARLDECHEPHFGDFSRRLAVPGNHDWRDPGAAGFFSLFPDALPRAVAVAPQWRLLLLDSSLRDAAWERQLRWLEQSVKDAAGQCLIAAWHYPRWASGRRGDYEFVSPVWKRVAGRAALTLHGHDHFYEAFPPLDADGQMSPAGTRSFIVGNGGAKLYESPGATRGSKLVTGKWGFMRLEIDGLDYAWQALAVDGQVIDAGSGRCRPVGD